MNNRKLSSKLYAVGIGAANLDIYGKTSLPIKEHYDHPGTIYATAGGVTRNVCENLANLGTDIKLISAIGDDFFGKMIIGLSEEAKIDMSNIIRVKNCSSAAFMQVQDKNNDMHLAICDMSINKNITVSFLKTKTKLLKNAKLLIVDPSLSKEVIKYLCSLEVPLFLDTVSDFYAKKIIPYIKYIYTIKCNKTEAESITGIKIINKETLLKAANKILNKGCKRIYITLGRKGSFYIDKNESILMKIKESKNVVNASGCGDAFFATVIYGYIKGYSNEETLKLALVFGKETLKAEGAINKNITANKLNKLKKGEKYEKLRELSFNR